MKCVRFHFAALSGGALRWEQAVLMAAAVPLVGTETLLASSLLEDLTRRSGLLRRRLHAHELHYDPSLAGHVCDLCRLPVKVCVCACACACACVLCVCVCVCVRTRARMRARVRVRESERMCASVC